MRRSGTSQSKTKKVFPFFTAVIACVVFAIAPLTAAGQSKTPAKTPQTAKKGASPSTKNPAKKKNDDMPWLQEALKDPEFMKAVGHLTDRLSNEVQMPAPRTQSRILPRLSDSTMFYGALPNYGPVLRQC